MRCPLCVLDSTGRYPTYWRQSHSNCSPLTSQPFPSISGACTTSAQIVAMRTRPHVQLNGDHALGQVLVTTQVLWALAFTSSLMCDTSN